MPNDCQGRVAVRNPPECAAVFGFLGPGGAAIGLRICRDSTISTVKAPITAYQAKSVWTILSTPNEYVGDREEKTADR